MLCMQLGRSPAFVGTLSSFYAYPSQSSWSWHRVLHGTARRYLSGLPRRVGVADMSSKSRLRSSSSNLLDVCPSRLVTARDRSFASVGLQVWNSLHDDVTSYSSLFRRKLKNYLSQHAVIPWHYFSPQCSLELFSLRPLKFYRPTNVGII